MNTGRWRRIGIAVYVPISAVPLVPAWLDYIGKTFRKYVLVENGYELQTISISP